jgi:hypothetical protein
MRDAFKSDTRYGGNPFQPGEYVVIIELTIEGGPTFSFDTIGLSFSQPKKGNRH